MWSWTSVLYHWSTGIRTTTRPCCVVLMIQPRSLYILDKYSLSWATSPPQSTYCPYFWLTHFVVWQRYTCIWGILTNPPLSPFTPTLVSLTSSLQISFPYSWFVCVLQTLTSTTCVTVGLELSVRACGVTTHQWAHNWIHGLPLSRNLLGVNSSAVRGEVCLLLTRTHHRVNFGG